MTPEILSSILSLVVLAAVTPLLVFWNDDGDLMSATIFAIPIAIFGAIAVARLLANQRNVLTMVFSRRFKQ